MTQKHNSALDRAIQVLGSQQAIAKLCGVTQQYVSDVRRGVRRNGLVPAEWCRQIACATKAAGSEVSCEELRPDLFRRDEGSTKRVRQIICKRSTPAENQKA